jgi:hypothetical protein
MFGLFRRPKLDARFAPTQALTTSLPANRSSAVVW